MMNVRAAITVGVLVSFFGVMGFLLIYPVVTSTDVDGEFYLQYLGFALSAYTGGVGYILGYYFNRQADGPSQSSAPGSTHPPS